MQAERTRNDLNDALKKTVTQGSVQDLHRRPAGQDDLGDISLDQYDFNNSSLRQNQFNSASSSQNQIGPGPQYVHNVESIMIGHVPIPRPFKSKKAKQSLGTSVNVNRSIMSSISELKHESYRSASKSNIKSRMPVHNSNRSVLGHVAQLQA